MITATPDQPHDRWRVRIPDHPTASAVHADVDLTTERYDPTTATWRHPTHR